jgi:hypothetical protein
MKKKRAKNKRGRADLGPDNDASCAPPSQNNADVPTSGMDTEKTFSPSAENSVADCAGNGNYPETILSPICDAIQSHHREREISKKLRVKMTNGLAATIMAELGYRATLPSEQRATYRKRADKLIACVVKGKDIADADKAVAARFAVLIATVHQALDPFVAHEKQMAERMFGLGEQLPVAVWLADVRGCDFIQLAMIIGETGDLSRYSTVGKVWKRLGLMPFNGSMPSQWAKRGGLTKEDWIKIGYNPRRRAIMYVCAKSLMMQNDGIFRDRYDQSKAKAKELHPDWKPCHLDAHALLCTAKCFIKHLWCQWNNKPVC